MFLFFFMYGSPKALSGYKVGVLGLFGALVLKASTKAVGSELEGVKDGFAPPAFGSSSHWYKRDM